MSPSFSDPVSRDLSQLQAQCQDETRIGQKSMMKIKINDRVLGDGDDGDRRQKMAERVIVLLETVIRLADLQLERSPPLFKKECRGKPQVAGLTILSTVTGTYGR